MVSADIADMSKKVDHDGFPTGLEVDAAETKIKKSLNPLDEHYTKSFTYEELLLKDNKIVCSG